MAPADETIMEIAGHVSRQFLSAGVVDFYSALDTALGAPRV